jgi:hypothetical protein
MLALDLKKTQNTKKINFMTKMFEFTDGVSDLYPYVDVVMYHESQWDGVCAAFLVAKSKRQIAEHQQAESKLSLSIDKKVFEITSLFAQLWRAMEYTPGTVLMLKKTFETLSHDAINSLYVSFYFVITLIFLFMCQSL